MNIKEKFHTFVGDLSVTYSLLQDPQTDLWYVRADADGPAASRSETSGAFPQEGEEARCFFRMVIRGGVTPCTLLALYDDFRLEAEDPLASPLRGTPPPSP